jgi:hypothetical protein
MFNQHAKWLKVSAGLVAAEDRLVELPAGLHVWRQDHNGFTHQDPAHRPRRNKKAEVVRVPAAGTPTAAVGDDHAQPPLRQRRDRGQAPGPAMADDGRQSSTARKSVFAGPATTRDASDGHGPLWRRPRWRRRRRVHMRERLPDPRTAVNAVDLMSRSRKASTRTG